MKLFPKKYHICEGDILLYKDKSYEAEPSVITYDPLTLQPKTYGIIVKLESGKWIKCIMDDFYDLQEYRDQKLTKILE